MIYVHKQKVSLCVDIFVRPVLLYNGASEAEEKGLPGVLLVFIS